MRQTTGKVNNRPIRSPASLSPKKKMKYQLVFIDYDGSEQVVTYRWAYSTAQALLLFRKTAPRHQVQSYQDRLIARLAPSQIS